MEETIKASENLQSSILQRILAWSSNQPVWQQDALRRLIEKQTLSEEDIEELTAICKAEYFGSEGDEEHHTLVPLSSDHLPDLYGDPVKISLTEISNIRNANALTSNESLTMNKDGLIAVYGDNASGKTGYIRILKKACRARAPGGAILPNIYDNTQATPASAEIKYYEDEQIHDFEWFDGIAAPPALSTISVFDSTSAQIQVSEANEVLFTPFGLDLLERLASTCLRVAERLQSELTTLDQQRPPSIVNNQLQSETHAGSVLTHLNQNSNLKEIQQFATLNKNENDRYNQLREDLVKDPVIRAQQIRRQAAKAKELKISVERSNELLSDNAPDLANQIIKDYQIKAEAAKVASTKKYAFDDEPLDGVGGEVWKELWEAARQYSYEIAYSGKEFPVVGESALCVLCFQPLSDIASARLIRFEEFIKDATHKSAEEARQKFDGMISSVEEIDISDSRRIIDLVGLEDPKMMRNLRLLLVRSKLRRRYLQRILKGGEQGSYPDVPIDVIDQIAEHIKKLESRAQELEAASRSQERQQLRDQYTELQDRILLSELIDDIDTEIKRLKRVEQYKKALSDTGTYPVTRFSSQLAEDVLNIEVQESFKNELSNIGLDTIQVELVNVGGQYGTQRFRVQLAGYPEIGPNQILSDGEGGAIALAGFLSEIGVAAHQSSIIFDDPVSSLDHNWKNAFAQRLVQVAQDRQVIVFTHNTVFLMALLEYSERLNVNVQSVHLSRRNLETGIPMEGEPWIAMPVRKRIGFLKNMLQRIRPLSESNPDVYKLNAQSLYGLLRETWERAVEEILLNQTVLRFRRSIETRRLRVLTDITDTDIQEIDTAMTKCSQYLPGHDEPAATQDTIPNSDEIAGDIVVLEEWIAAMRRRDRN